MDIRIIKTRTHHPVPSVKIKKLIGLILKKETSKPLESLSIVFLGDTDMRRINKQFLRHDFVTDVIAFNLSTAKTIEGEIYIGLDKAAAQAKEYGVTTANEILRLAAHGFLHILGYEDDSATKKKRMLELGDHYISLLK